MDENPQRVSDWTWWSNIKTGSVYELSCLAKQINPNYSHCTPSYVNSVGIGVMIRLAMDDPYLAKGNLRNNTYDSMRGWPHDKGCDPALATVYCREFAKWAERLNPPWLGTPPPPEFPGLVRAAIPDYLNRPDHRWYSVELDAAMQCWNALYRSGGEIPKAQGSEKTTIKKWLKCKFPQLGNEAQERIAVMLNQDKRDGSKK